MRSLVDLSARLAAVALVVASGGCGDDDPFGPGPAVFEIVLGAGSPPAAAMLFMIEGGTVDSVESAGWYTASAPFSGVATQVVVAGPTLTGTVALVHVPDGRTRYTAVVREVAQAGTHALLPTGDYSLTLARR